MIKEQINIIIADDNKLFIEGLKVALKNSYKYVIADICFNGKELVESKHLRKADLIIMDIQMPVMNGIEAALIVNLNYPKLPMIAITMHFDKAFLKDLIGAGFRGFIYKPEVSKKLNGVILEVLDQKLVFPDNLNVVKPIRNGGAL